MILKQIFSFSLCLARSGETCDSINCALLKLACIAIGASFTVACSSQSEIPVNTIYQSQQCAISDAQLVFLESPEQFYGFIESATKFQLTESEAEISPPGVAGRAVVVAWGNQPNGGYRLELTGNRALIDDETLKLPVNFVAPEQDQLTAQLTTSPCLVISLASRAGYQRVKAGKLLSVVPDPR